MKKFSELNVGDEFFSQGKITQQELENYLIFSGIKNVLYKDNEQRKIVSGRAILSRMEEEFTKLEEMYGNLLIFYGMDGEPSWKGRHARFLKPLYTDEILKMKFRISEKSDLNDNFGLLAIDFEGTKEDGDLVVLAKRNLYQIKKDQYQSLNQ
jgi:hypothetical protein